MSTIACENCSAVLSDAAEKCPKCRYPTPRNQGRCRKCYTILAKSEHRYKAYSNHVINGNTSSSSYIRHVPCTNCGEPEPLHQSGIAIKEYWILLCLFFPPLFFFIGPQWARKIPVWSKIFIIIALFGANALLVWFSRSDSNNTPAPLTSAYKPNRTASTKTLPAKAEMVPVDAPLEKNLRPHTKTKQVQKEETSSEQNTNKIRYINLNE